MKEPFLEEIASVGGTRAVDCPQHELVSISFDEQIVPKFGDALERLAKHYRRADVRGVQVWVRLR